MSSKSSQMLSYHVTVLRSKIYLRFIFFFFLFGSSKLMIDTTFKETKLPKFVKVKFIKVFGQNQPLFEKYSKFKFITNYNHESRVFTMGNVNDLIFTFFINCPKDVKSIKFSVKLFAVLKDSNEDSFECIGLASKQINPAELVEGSSENVHDMTFFLKEDPNYKEFYLRYLVFLPNTHDTYEPIKRFQMSDFNESSKKFIRENEFFNLYEIKDKEMSQRYLLKEYKHLPNTPICVDDMKNIDILNNFPVLLQVKGYVTCNDDENNVQTIVYEHMSHYTLDELCETERKDVQPASFNNTKKSIIFYQISYGLSVLHSYGCVHRHLNPSNILIDKETLNVKLYDYELTTELHMKVFDEYYRQLPSYIPPPILQESNDEDENTKHDEEAKQQTEGIEQTENEQQDTFKDAKIKENIFGEDIFALGLILFEISSMMKKSRENNDDIKYLSSNLRTICKQMWHPIPNQRPRIEEITSMIKIGNCIIFETNIKILKEEINNFEELIYENIHNPFRRDLQQDLVKGTNLNDSSSFVCAASILFAYDSIFFPKIVTQNINNLNNSFLIAALGITFLRGLCNEEIDISIGSDIFVELYGSNVEKDYHYGVRNFDYELTKDLKSNSNYPSIEISNEGQIIVGEKKGQTDDISYWWQYQQLRTGLRNATFYYDTNNEQKLFPQFKSSIATIAKLLLKDVMTNGADSDNVDSCVSLTQILQLSECPIKNLDLFIPLQVLGWTNFNTVSLGMAIMMVRQTKEEEKNEEFGKIGSAHNFIFAISDLSAFYFDRNRVDESFHYAYKGALNFDPQCELILGLIYHKKGELDKAKEYLIRAKDHGDKRAPSILARMLMFEGQSLNEAENLFKESSEDTKNDLIALYIRQRQFDKLIQFLQQNYSEPEINQFFNSISSNPNLNQYYEDICKAGVDANCTIAMHKYAIYLINTNQKEKLLLNVKDSSEKAKLASEDKKFEVEVKREVADQQRKIYDQAKELFEKAIERGNIPSYFSLAQLYFDYYKDNDKAYKLAQISAEKGDVFGKCLLGIMTMKGISTNSDFEKGAEMILSTGEVTEQFYLANYGSEIAAYYQKKGNQDKALEYLKKGANYHDEACVVQLAHYYMTHNENEKAFKLFEISYNREKTAGSINNYGICFLNGIGTKKDWERAKAIFQEGLLIDDCNSMYHLAYIYENENPEESLRLYEKAAENGEPHAMRYLVDKFDKEGNEEKKLKYLRMHASCGDPISQFELGLYYYNNDQFQQAFQYFSLASIKRVDKAIYYFAIMTYKGQGTCEDKESAITILKKLAQSGMSKAQDFLDEVEKEN